MVVTHKFETDLVKRRPAPLLSMVQGDSASRRAEITLLADGEPWEPESVSDVFVRYRKADGSKSSYNAGKYDASVNGNVLTVDIAEEVLDQPGKAWFQVVLSVGEQSISIFAVVIDVQQNVMD